MALDAKNPLVYDAPAKDLYGLGEMPPLGHVPAQMYAWAIRRERHGAPDTAMQVEVVETPSIDSNEVLVMVMAAGVNYNGVWAIGHPGHPTRTGGDLGEVHLAKVVVVGDANLLQHRFALGQHRGRHPAKHHRDEQRPPHLAEAGSTIRVRLCSRMNCWR